VTPETFTAITDALAEPMYLLDADGVILAANAAARRLAPASVPGRPLFELVDDAEALARYLAACARSPVPVPGALRLRARAGATACLAAGNVVATDDDGHPAALLLRCQVLDQRSQALLGAERRVLELLAAGETLPAALGHLARAVEEQRPDMLVSVLLLDDGGLRQVAAPSLPETYARMADGAADGSAGAAAALARPVVAADIERDPLWAGLREAALGHGLRACSAAPILAGDGRVLGALAAYFREARAPTAAEIELIDDAAHVARVAIEHHRALRERDRLFTREQTARLAAEAANTAKDLFLATLSHELRTPLTAILGWTRLLRIGAAPATVVPHALEVIERNTRLQERLINDLLDISRIVAGKLRIDRTLVDPVEVVAGAIETVLPSAQARGVTVEQALDATAGPVLGDADRLQQVVRNLLSNAVKFAPEGGRVAVTLARDGDDAVIAVSDSGSGIDPAFLPHAFERFEQGVAAPGSGPGGLGLGLAIARHLVELHGGTIDAAPTGPLGGAVFTVRLRRVPGQVPGAAASAGVDAVLPTLTGARVLVVEDEADTRAFIVTTLERSGGTVEATGGADEALAAIETFRPDVLVADLRMPGKDGYALIREIRARDTGAGRRLPALALTAYADPDEARRARDAGFDRYVPKPVEPAALVRAVAGTLGDV